MKLKIFVIILAVVFIGGVIAVLITGTEHLPFKLFGGDKKETQSTSTYQESRYTADQVITVVARSQFCPVCWNKLGGTRNEAAARVTVKYVGGSRAAWEAQISCPNMYLPTGITKVYFYETDGSIHDTYYP
jgi:hypothetical protein